MTLRFGNIICEMLASGAALMLTMSLVPLSFVSSARSMACALIVCPEPFMELPCCRSLLLMT